MDRAKLNMILEKHKMWLKNEEDGERADFSYANLANANLANTDLRGVLFIDACLSGANLVNSNCSGVYFTNTDLRDADLRNAKLINTTFYGAKLDNAEFGNADIRGANFSGATGLVSQWEFIKNKFESTTDGIIAYKTFNDYYQSPESWKIEKGSVIMENVNFNRVDECGCGINVAPLEWVEAESFDDEMWKVLIRWEWLAGVCVPYNSDGKIRCECVELLEIVGGDEK